MYLLLSVVTEERFGPRSTLFSGAFSAFIYARQYIQIHTPLPVWYSIHKQKYSRYPTPMFVLVLVYVFTLLSSLSPLAPGLYQRDQAVMHMRTKNGEEVSVSVCVCVYVCSYDGCMV